MIIDIKKTTTSNYKPGSAKEGKNIILDKPGISELLEKLTREPAAPGDVYLIDGGQVVALDGPDRLCMVVSETGPLALNRIWSDQLEPVKDALSAEIPGEPVKVTQETKIDYLDPDDYIDIADKKVRLWTKSKEVPGAIWKLETISGMHHEPVTVYAKGNKAYFSVRIEESVCPYILNDIFNTLIKEAVKEG